MVSVSFLILLIISVGTMLSEIGLQRLWIRKMHSLKIEQITKDYGPSWHEKTKLGTPTMGGVVFIPLFILFAILCSFGIKLTTRTIIIYSYPIAASIVGLIDDWMKHSKASSDGLTSRQKFLLQVIVTFIWAMLIGPETIDFIPGISLPIYLSLPLLLFIGVGFQNAVNVTDGLDGLATGAMLISLIFALVISALSNHITPVDCAVLLFGIGLCVGFLWHNSNPATVFMGDVGAHFFSGLLLAFCVSNGTVLTIIPLGFLFGIEIISVSLQIFAIRKFNRRIFKMSPIHHHFELCGWKENKIINRFLIAHTTGIIILVVIFYAIVENI